MYATRAKSTDAIERKIKIGKIPASSTAAPPRRIVSGLRWCRCVNLMDGSYSGNFRGSASLFVY
jgi:hypothetical protein